VNFVGLRSFVEWINDQTTTVNLTRFPHFWEPVRLEATTKQGDKKGKKADTTISRGYRGLDRHYTCGEALGSRTTTATRIETTGGLMILI